MTDPLIDGDGHASMIATLADGREGIWQETSPGTLELTVIEGGASPIGGLNFDNIISYALNDSGQIAFEAELDDSTIGVFATDKSGAIVPVVLIGDLIEINGTDVLVDDVRFKGLAGFIPQSGRGVTKGLNDSGQVAVMISGELQDGSFNYIEAILVSDAATGGAQVPGDANGDGNVDLLDLDILGMNFGTMGGATFADGDFNGDGNVDLLDLDILGGNFGFMSPSTSVPEPAGLILCFVALLSAVASRRR